MLTTFKQWNRKVYKRCLLKFTMVNKIKQIKIREQEYKKLLDYKVHPKQPFWEVIKRIIEENKKKEVSEDENLTDNKKPMESLEV